MIKKLILPVIIVCIIVAGIVLTLNSGRKGDKCAVADLATAPTPTQLSIVQQVIDTGGILVDVRTPEEFALEHAKDAINIPLSEIEKGIYPVATLSQSTYLYCRTGNRASQAKTILETAGFTNVTNIGGLTDWQTQGGEAIGS